MSYTTLERSQLLNHFHVTEAFWGKLKEAAEKKVSPVMIVCYVIFCTRVIMNNFTMLCYQIFSVKPSRFKFTLA